MSATPMDLKFWKSVDTVFNNYHLIDPNHYYVYLITDKRTGEYYIGFHHCKKTCPPELHPYMGSGKWTGWMIDNGNLPHMLKETVQIFNKSEDALALESQLIGEHRDNPLNRNYWKRKPKPRLSWEDRQRANA